MKRIGIPHSLFYFYYYPLWKTFFEDLGWEVVTSSPSSRLTIEMGINTAVDEVCFPVKVYLGHVRELCRCKLDYLFVPRLVSIEERSYICPKFMGIPDMVRALVEDAPPLIDIVVDMSKNQKDFKNEMIKLGRLLSVQRKDWERAYRHGLQELEFCRALAREGYTMSEAIKIWEGQPAPAIPEADLNIGLLGHGYSIYDPGISLDMINRLRRMGCEVLLPERLERKAVEEQASTVPKRVFWTLGRSMLGSALHLDQRDDVDGIIYVACFACGPDSIIGEVIERKVKNKPFMFLTIDEHTGEAGMLTRLEAFCDMLRRRRMNACDSHLSSHG